MKSFPYIPKTSADALSVLYQIPGLTAYRLRKLLQKVDNEVMDVFRLSFDDLLKMGIPQVVALNLITFQAEQFLEEEQILLQKHQAQRITRIDDEYPDLLKEIPDHPLCFYRKGQWPANAAQAIAIVGTRTPSFYGLEMAQRLAEELTEQGLLVVSGMALGIDGAAHRGALKAQGSTIAVLGTGLDQVYPKSHQGLFEEIVEQGCVISEFPFGTKPHPFNFPRRNRIVSGLCLGVVVVESFLRSGALITARLAGEQSREVFAVPGRIDQPLSAGPHHLIKQGAKLIETSQDIIEELFPSTSSNIQDNDVDLSADEKQVLGLMKKSEASMDEILSQVDFEITHLHGILFSLEMKKKIRETVGKNYILY